MQFATYIRTHPSAQLPPIEKVFQFLGKIEMFTTSDTGGTDSQSISSVSDDRSSFMTFFRHYNEIFILELPSLMPIRHPLRQLLQMT